MGKESRKIKERINNGGNDKGKERKSRHRFPKKTHRRHIDLNLIFKMAVITHKQFLSDFIERDRTTTQDAGDPMTCVPSIADRRNTLPGLVRTAFSHLSCSSFFLSPPEIIHSVSLQHSLAIFRSVLFLYSFFIIPALFTIPSPSISQSLSNIHIPSVSLFSPFIRLL